MNTCKCAALTERVERLEAERAEMRADFQRVETLMLSAIESWKKSFKASEDFRAGVVAALKLKLEQPNILH
jgi:hypothetical protein